MRSKSAAKTKSADSQTFNDNSWIEQEAQGCQFQDVRLAKRFIKLLEMISGGVGETIPTACQDWANTKAAYRFLSNERVAEDQILAGHFEATAVRMALAQGPFLVLHDTTEFSYERADPDALGFLSQIAVGKTKDGRPRLHTVRGILMHSSMAVTLEGLPLGLAAVKFWTRKKFKGCEALKHKINPTRVPIEEKESYRWLENVRQSTALAEHAWDCVHIGDRESDIYELFCTAQEIDTRFLVRTCVDRLAEEGHTTIAQEMKAVAVQGTHCIGGRGKDGKDFEAVLEVKYHTLRVRHSPFVGPRMAIS